MQNCANLNPVLRKLIFSLQSEGATDVHAFVQLSISGTNTDAAYLAEYFKQNKAS